LIAATGLSGSLPKISGTFLTAFFAAQPLEIIAILLYYKAFQLSPLSLTLPFLSVTPIFLTVISYVIVDQRASAFGATGIALIGLGGCVEPVCVSTQ